MSQSSPYVGARSAEAGFFTQVYRWMAVGMFVSAAGAWLSLATGLYRSPAVMIICILVELGLVFWLSAKIMSMPLQTAVSAFLAYSALNGVTIASLLAYYTQASVIGTFCITAGTFLVFSIYGMTTKKDLTSMGSLAMMGLIGFFIASIVNLFLASPALYWIVTYGFIAVFLGLIAYDTQQLKLIHQQGVTGEEAGKLAIIGALKLYLDFINLFIFLLRIFGRRD